MGNSKKHVRLKRLDWDAEFYTDLATGRGFIISEPAEVSLDGSKKKSLYGADSPLYGTSYDDEQAFAERYRCDCAEGGFIGRQFEGEICPYCGKPVTFKDTDINVTGWISIEPNKIISPYYYKILSQAIGKTVFSDIINPRYKITTDGHRERPTDDDEIKLSSEFSGIGVEEFYRHYESIIAHFQNLKPNKHHVFENLLKEKKCVFISHIPIITKMLRPKSVTSDTFYYNSIDKLINTSFSISRNLQDCIDVEKDYLLYRLQGKVNEMWDILFEELNGKEGLIRGDLLGGSINYSSRNVIVPDPTLKDNEIDLSYHTFLEVFKYRIIYYLMKLDDVVLSKAHATWKAASVFSEKVYNVMMYIVEKEHAKLLINRNPTLIDIWCCKTSLIAGNSLETKLPKCNNI